MKIDGMNSKISLRGESMADRISRRDPSFAQRLEAAVSDVNVKQHQADTAIEKVIKGEMGIHEGMQMMGKADTTLRLLAQVRNKAMTAYNEIMRMQI